MESMHNDVFRFYSDESSHLGKTSDYMVIGAIWCNENEVRNFTDRIKMLREKHGIPKHWETKWTKVSGAKEKYYLDLVRTFFGEEGVNYRAIVIPTAGLDHDLYGQTEDEFYYKAQYMMLKNVVEKLSSGESKMFRIFLDYKDTWSDTRSKKLAEYLKKTHNFTNNTFGCQPIRSDESTMIQMADFLTGAVASANNKPDTKVRAKQSVIGLVEELSGQKLTSKTPYGVDKFNLFRWHDAKEEKQNATGLAAK